MQGWKGLLLSRAGKEVLIKAVAQAIPTYTMGVFQLPVKLCNDLNAMYARCFKARYFPQVFYDKWMPNYPTNRALHPPLDGDWDCRVSDLIDWNTYDWNRSIIAIKLHPEDMEAMVRIPLSRRHVPDVWMWLYNKRGNFSVRSGYYIARMIAKEGNGLMESSNREGKGEVWLVQRAKDFLQEYQDAQTQLSVPIPSGLMQQQLRWVLPLGSAYKLNVDAAVFKGMKASGYGAVVRNDKGRYGALFDRQSAIKLSGMSEKAYNRSFNLLQNSLGVKNNLDVRELAI
ncbi:hypothetical protein SO802_011483 [Lithocarpus litseifolius]|uniref:ORC6 first cyclin-like domain-containing protein n=1 Tax=Lithocarpus litseifolius TaxID=425828 RepID=A0AAW2D049_9ROSI